MFLTFPIDIVLEFVFIKRPVSDHQSNWNIYEWLPAQSEIKLYHTVRYFVGPMCVLDRIMDC